MRSVAAASSSAPREQVPYIPVKIVGYFDLIIRIHFKHDI